jgi:hypothetical protein
MQFRGNNKLVVSGVLMLICHEHFSRARLCDRGGRHALAKSLNKNLRRIIDG